MGNYTVYMHISPSGKKYIGITCQNPKKRWQNGKGYKENKYFYNAIKKYGWDGFQHVIITKGLTKEEACWLEIELIKVWDSINKEKGYNIATGGETPSPTEETRRKMSEARKNIWCSSSKESRRKLSEAISKARAKSVICITTKKIFNTVTEGAEYYGCLQGHISNVCNNKESFAGKLEDGTPLVWMYLEDYEKATEEEINKKIKDAKKLIKITSSSKAVICITTNAVFYTIKEGAKYYNCGGSEISKCCKKIKYFKSAGKLSDGTKLVWRYIEIIEL